MNMEEARKAVVEFMQCDTDAPRYVGEQDGTRYTDGGQDVDMYFEVNDRHVVASYRHVGDEITCRLSDGVVWPNDE